MRRTYYVECFSFEYGERVIHWAKFTTASSVAQARLQACMGKLVMESWSINIYEVPPK